MGHGLLTWEKDVIIMIHLENVATIRLSTTVEMDHIFRIF